MKSSKENYGDGCIFRRGRAQELPHAP